MEAGGVGELASSVGRAKEPIDAKKLCNWKLLEEFRCHMAMAQARATILPDPKRKLLEEGYFSRLLFGLFNPVVDSMHGLSVASRISLAQEVVCSRPVSLGSFSEAQSAFDPERLKQVFLELSGEADRSWGNPRLGPLADTLKPMDGTLFPALPRMHSALWLDDRNRAAKLHPHFIKVLRHAASDALGTTGNTCEQKGEMLAGDRCYGLEYVFLDERRACVSIVFRIRNKPKVGSSRSSR